ncbi:oligoribonuclease [Candidatus Spongiihabitans sp.]|uniref:oligoribonuclease n=1 Tax=Candidatus Spongiihabitans sp. TaxID=3101308 RepID=UPI003C6EEDDA
MHPQNLVWIDLEMTGLSPEHDRIIEIASIATDAQLNILAEGPVMAIYQSLKRLADMDKWNTKTHTESGLVKRVRASTINEKQAEQRTIDFISKYVAGNHSPLCGNTICQDRRFLANYMPSLEAYFHYRNLDVSSVKELVLRWRPDLLNGFSKQNTHKALDDIRESIEELKYYRKTFIKWQP